MAPGQCTDYRGPATAPQDPLRLDRIRMRGETGPSTAFRGEIMSHPRGTVSGPDSRIRLTLQVNGEAVDVLFDTYKTLLEVLREDLGLIGTKHGCELGECGACAVLVDSRPVLSCLLLAAECEGRDVRTVEGLAQGSCLHPVQRTFADLGAAQ